MRKPILSSILILILSSLACGQYIGTPTPVSTPNALVVPTQTANPTPTPRLSPSATPASTAQTAMIRTALVNVRSAPEGAVIGQLKAGDAVKVNKCTNNWCEVSTDVISGYVWQGCLSEVNTDNLGCSAK